ncbi:hypothetical protein [Thalassotalea montiporae]
MSESLTKKLDVPTSTGDTLLLSLATKCHGPHDTSPYWFDKEINKPISISAFEKRFESKQPFYYWTLDFFAIPTDGRLKPALESLNKSCLWRFLITLKAAKETVIKLQKAQISSDYENIEYCAGAPTIFVKKQSDQISISLLISNAGAKGAHIYFDIDNFFKLIEVIELAQISGELLIKEIEALSPLKKVPVITKSIESKESMSFWRKLRHIFS